MVSELQNNTTDRERKSEIVGINMKYYLFKDCVNDIPRPKILSP